MAYTDAVNSQADVEPIKDQTPAFTPQWVWRNVVIFIMLHIGAIYGVYLLATTAMWTTVLFVFWLYIFGGLGITAGAHRLWAHRTYKANVPFRILLMLQNCVAVQNHIIEWSRDHRVHHKFSETDADPHNARRGLFFAHVGWLLQRKHPDVRNKGKTVDVGDLEADPVLAFQKKFYVVLVITMCFVLPTVIPYYLWSESLFVSYFTAGVFRYVFTLNCTWTVNSLAHMFGSRPYDARINPRQNYVSVICTVGEGWHNYHHTFPQDYRASEFPLKLNLTTAYIDLFASIGWVYDRKVVSDQIIDNTRLRYGE